MSIEQFTENIITLFLEYRDKHGYSEEKAKEAVLYNMADPDINMELIDMDALKALQEKAGLKA